MIDAQTIINMAKDLEVKMGEIDGRMLERWTLCDDQAVKDALESLGSKASILYIKCMTDEEMADLEREGRDDG